MRPKFDDDRYYLLNFKVLGPAGLTVTRESDAEERTVTFNEVAKAVIDGSWTLQPPARTFGPSIEAEAAGKAVRIAGRRVLLELLIIMAKYPDALAADWVYGGRLSRDSLFFFIEGDGDEPSSRKFHQIVIPEPEPGLDDFPPADLMQPQSSSSYIEAPLAMRAGVRARRTDPFGRSIARLVQEHISACHRAAQQQWTVSNVWASAAPVAIRVARAHRAGRRVRAATRQSRRQRN